MLNRSQAILVRTDSNLCRKELTVHWSAPNSLTRSYLQLCTNSMWGNESEGVAPIIWLYKTVDAQKEEVFSPDLLITLRRHDIFHSKHAFENVVCKSAKWRQFLLGRNVLNAAVFLPPWAWLNILNSRQKWRHFADGIFKWISLKISLIFVHKFRIDNILALA